MILIIKIRVLDSKLFMKKQKSNKLSSKKIIMPELVTPLQQSLSSSTQNISFSVVMENELAQNQELLLAQNNQDESQKMSEIVNKLISKNKINSKNAFQVPLVNINNLRSYHSSDDTAWSIFSSVLEGSSKIYGYRVDGMSENINKMSQSILRNIGNQNQNTQLIKEIKYIHSEQSYDFNDFRLDLHIQKEKMQLEQLEIQNRTNPSNFRIRRLMDQNGISGLILGTVHISSDLSVGIQYQYFPLRRKSFQKIEVEENSLKNFSAKCTSKQLSITKQISNIFNVKNQVLNYSIQQIDMTNNFILEQLQNSNLAFQNLKQQAHGQEIINQQKIFRQFPEIIENEFKFQDRVIHKKSKRYKINKTKKKQNKVKPKNKQQTSENKQISFMPFIELDKNQILKANIIQEGKGANKKVNGENIQENFHSLVQKSFQNNVTIQNSFIYSSIVSLEKKQKDQQIGSLTNFSEQINQNISIFRNNYFLTSQKQLNQDQQGEDNQKCLNIKQNKIQLEKILQGIQNKIKFSSLIHLHKQASPSTNQAIDFLTILHLANQLGLSLLQINSIDFFIQK